MPTDINWPSGLPTGEALPCPLREGYGYQQRSPNLVTRRAIATRSRRIYSDAPVDFPAVAWVMSAQQRYYFEGWYWEVLDAGNLYFNAPLLLNGEVEQVEVSFEGLVPRYELIGANHWRVSAALATRKGTQPAPEVFLGYLNENDHIIG